MFNHVKYDTQDHKGVTRRERNKLAGYEVQTPEVELQPEFQYLWDWFFELSNTRHDFEKRLNFSDIDAWSRLSGNNITPTEFEIISAMDGAFVSAFQSEMSANRQRQKSEQDALARVSGRK